MLEQQQVSLTHSWPAAVQTSICLSTSHFLGLFKKKKVKLNHSSFPEEEIVLFLSGCTKYKFQPFSQAGHWSLCCLHFFICPSHCQSMGLFYSWWIHDLNYDKLTTLYDNPWKQVWSTFHSREENIYLPVLLFSYIQFHILFIHFLKFNYFAYFFM